MIRVPHPLASASRSEPDRVAVSIGSDELTYGALSRAVALAAGGLQEMGVEPGSRVAIIGPTSLEWVIAFHAVGWLGAVAQPLAHRCTRAGLSKMLETAQPDWLLTDSIPPETWADRTRSIALPRGADAVAERDWPLDEVRLEIASSGTTTGPRMVTLTVSQLLFGAMGSALRLGHLPGDGWLCCLPTHHVGGLSILLRCAWYGTTVVLLSQFDARKVAATLASGKVTHVSLVPTMLSDVVEVDFEAHSRLRVVLLGGAAAPQALLDRCRQRGLPVALTWGMTETASQVATRAPGDLREAADVGAPLVFSRVVESSGGLVVEGPVAPMGRLATRDMGRLDERGRVVLAGRLDDLIVSGGENIHPATVESVLESHPAVSAAVVVGRPDERWGQRPVAWLESTSGDELPSDEMLDAWCRKTLAGFEVPDVFRWRDALPRTELGKLARSTLREQEAALQLAESGR